MNRTSKEANKVQGMFSSIAPRYDLLNKILSLGRDRYWREFAVRKLPEINNGVFLDVATGTADIAIEIVKHYPLGINVIGVDFSHHMLELGRKKVERLRYSGRIKLRHGDANSLPFEDNTFDGAIVAFGIRNLPDYKKGFQEMVRVLKNGGRMVVLEFTPLERMPFTPLESFSNGASPSFLTGQSYILRYPYKLYLTKVLPLIGEIISGRKGAYKYLSDSVVDFPDPEKLKEIMKEAGLREVKYYLLTFGTVAVHVGIK